MKKIIALVILVTCLIAFSGCGIAGTILGGGISAVSSSVSPDYEGEPETFYFGELSITLTERFWQDYDVNPGYGVFTSLAGTTVAVEKNQFMYSGYSEGLSAVEYAATFRELLESGEAGFEGVSRIGEVAERGGVVYLGFDVGEVIVTKYIAAFYVGADSLWICYFSQSKSNYDKYEPYFLEWAASVKINNTNAEV